MNLKRKIGMVAGALLITGGLLTGAALAAEPDAAAQAAQAAKQTVLSEGQKGLLQQLHDLRKSYMEKFQAEAKALTDQAVAEGKVTQEEADRLLQKGGRGFGVRGHYKMMPRGGGQGFGMGMKAMTVEAMKAKLDAAVANGTITAEQAAKMLEQFELHQAWGKVQKSAPKN